MDHGIPDYKDQSAVLARLTPALPAALAVRDYWDYWNLNAPVSAPAQQSEWTADFVAPYETYFRSYTGPGRLFLKVGSQAAKVRTGGRWRGFLSIPLLYQVHLQAFRDIARTMKATRIAYFPDCDDVDETFYENGTFDEGIAILQGYMGPPQPSIEVIAPEIVEETDRTVPGVWYLEHLEETSDAQ